MHSHTPEAPEMPEVPEVPEVPEALSVLTPREREVMYYIAQGKLNKVIAAEMDIKQRTVEAHRTKIFHKLKVRNAVGLVRFLIAHNIGLSHPPAQSADD